MHDEAFDLVHNRARQLHPRLGRFMQRDPLGYVDGLSLYESYSSSPQVLLDPTGAQTLTRTVKLTGTFESRVIGWQWQLDKTEERGNELPNDVIPDCNKDREHDEYFYSEAVVASRTVERHIGRATIEVEWYLMYVDDHAPSGSNTMKCDGGLFSEGGWKTKTFKSVQSITITTTKYDVFLVRIECKCTDKEKKKYEWVEIDRGN